MTQTPRDWQKDMDRVQQSKHGRTLCNAPVINLAWQDGLPDRWEDIAEYWLKEAKVYKQSYEAVLRYAGSVEDREQRLKEAAEKVSEIYESEYTDEEAVNSINDMFMDLLSTLYPDTPAPKEGDNQ